MKLTSEKLQLFAEAQRREREEGESYYDDSVAEAFQKFILRRHSRHPHTAETEVLSHLSEKRDILSYIHKAEGPVKLVDAGCGIGTESMLFAFLGADVVGVDARHAALRLANRRLEYFARALDTSLKCRFEHGDVIEKIRSYVVDAVWIREAISHIHPLESFLDQLAEVMQPGAMLFIREHNSGNWLVRSRLSSRLKKQGRQLGSVYTYHDDDTGNTFDFADERPFTPGSLRTLLTNAGFNVHAIHATGMIPKTSISKLFAFTGARRRAYRALWSVEQGLRQNRLLVRYAPAMIVISERI